MINDEYNGLVMKKNMTDLIIDAKLMMNDEDDERNEKKYEEKIFSSLWIGLKGFSYL